jgi:hypothetical protein
VAEWSSNLTVMQFGKKCNDSTDDILKKPDMLMHILPFYSKIVFESRTAKWKVLLKNVPWLLIIV